MALLVSRRVCTAQELTRLILRSRSNALLVPATAAGPSAIDTPKRRGSLLWLFWGRTRTQSTGHTQRPPF